MPRKTKVPAGATSTTALPPSSARRTIAVELDDAPVADLLEALRRRRETHGFDAIEVLSMLSMFGGTFRSVARAQALVLKKGKDYNKNDTSAASRDVYFPLGHASYAQMIHVKSQRILALVDAELNGRPVQFEGLFDTALDLINYASFLAERLERAAEVPLP